MQNKAELKSILDIDAESDFSIYNLPYGIYSTPEKSRRAGMAIGDQILDLAGLYELGYFDMINTNVFDRAVLNDFIELGQPAWQHVRHKVQALLSERSDLFRDYQNQILDKQADASMHLPVRIGDYTDFYSSEEHASNVGRMFRPNADPLLPNWKHMPIAYHGRSSSMVISGVPVKRPHGQYLQGAEVVFGPTQALDIELELGFVIGKENKMGEPVRTSDATDHIFGCVLLNDFSARDIQRWEYQPLGPFLGKNFATSISPWIVTLEALKPFIVPAPEQSPEVLPYLKQENRMNFDIELHFDIETKQHQKANVAASNSKYLYWTVEQQIAHHTVNGCNLRIGDLLGTGTISGKDKNSFGSLLELTWNGKEKIQIGDEERVFLQDGDTTVLKGFCVKNGKRIGFGELRNTIAPSP
jgi:fumarylacetoacetase